MLTPDDEWWRSEAHCRDSSPELFYPGGENSAGRQVAAYAAARILCGRCLVRTHCLEWAMTFEANADRIEDRAGMWGGLTPKQRHQLARRARHDGAA